MCFGGLIYLPGQRNCRNQYAQLRERVNCRVWGGDAKKTAASPSKRDLYENCGKSKIVKKSRVLIFHSIIAKLYCMCLIGEV
jgi:hypothetical protein